VVGEETQDILKVGLLTKIAGNYKKAEMESECVEASQEALDLMKGLSGEKDAQSCRCLLNLASVYQHFEKEELARNLYAQFLALFDSQNGENGQQDWS